MGSEWLKMEGRQVQSHSADLLEILHATRLYKKHYRTGLSMILEPDSAVPWRFGMWFVSFNPADLYHPHDWFNEASSQFGHVFNVKILGPRALDYFIEFLHENGITQ